MQVSSPSSAINEELFKRVIATVNSFRDKWQNSNHINLLTEADMQAWMFHYLLSDLCSDATDDAEGDASKICIHCCTPYLDDKLRDGGNLRKVPDITILDRREYSIDPQSELFSRKGFTVWGSAIMLEIKLHRPIYSTAALMSNWKADIDKLSGIRRAHFGGDLGERFFPLFVIFSRQSLSSQEADDIDGYASNNDVAIVRGFKPDS
jgi:hypothetical protein